MKKIYNFLIPYSLFLIPGIVLAQDNTRIWDAINGQWQPIGETFGGAVDPRVIVVRIILVLMGLLSIIFIAMILYAGFSWMTAGGNSEKIDKAKSTLINGTIGIGIIVGAYAITRFVILALVCAVSPEGGVCLFTNNFTGAP